jgi:DNA-binding beta-propeller fold protein YncE
MSKIKKIVNIIFLFFLFAGNFFSDTATKELKIANQFPTYDQMVKGNFSIYGGRDFDIHKEYIYMSDHSGHTIFKFDLDGNYIRQFGQEGQGPGDFQYPLHLQVYKNHLYIADNMNSRLQIINLDGTYNNQIKLVTIFMDLKIINNRIFIHNINTYNIDNTIIEIYNLKGSLLEKIKLDNMKSRFGNWKYNASLSMEMDEKFIYCLQQYDTAFYIFNTKGELVKEFNLEINPLDNTEYQKINYSYTFPCFYVHKDKIFTGISWPGKIMIKVFDMNGGFLFQLEKEMNDNQIYSPCAMKFVKRNEHDFLYILFSNPDTFFMAAEIN